MVEDKYAIVFEQCKYESYIRLGTYVSVDEHVVV